MSKYARGSVDGREIRERNRKERGKVEYRRMLARYDSESHLTAHYFIDLKTGEKIREIPVN